MRAHFFSANIVYMLAWGEIQGATANTRISQELKMAKWSRYLGRLFCISCDPYTDYFGGHELIFPQCYK